MSKSELSVIEAAPSRLRSNLRACVATVLAASAAAAPGALLVVSAAVSPAAMAQDYTSGVLTGRVDDSNGNPVPGAQVTVTIADNGRGLPPDFNVAGRRGLGLQIVEALVTKDLAGTLQLGTRAEGGSLATLTFYK